MPESLDRPAVTPVDYFAVAMTPRFRASMRRRIRKAARQGMLLVIAAAVLDCAWLVPARPDSASMVLEANVTIGLFAIAAFLVLELFGRRHAELVVYAMVVGVALAATWIGLFAAGLWLVAAGYLLLLPTVVALVVPWPTRVHIAWLALHAALVAAFVLLSPAAALPVGGRADMAGLLLIASTVSLVGHVAGLRARVQSFVQIERIQALYRQAGHDRARLERLNVGLEQTARTDDLTHLKNRLSLALDLEASRSRISRYGERYSIVLVDIDHFKAINDEFGHLGGDDALRQVANAMASAVRPSDGVYRYGGDEFLALIRVGETSDAMLAVERVIRAVRRLDTRNPANPPSGRITISAGVVVVDGSDLASTDEAWIARADEALYIAKKAGRNQAALAPEIGLVRAPMKLRPVEEAQSAAV